jgi:hypothetical protein
MKCAAKFNAFFAQIFIIKMNVILIHINGGDTRSGVSPPSYIRECITQLKRIKTRQITIISERENLEKIVSGPNTINTIITKIAIEELVPNPKHELLRSRSRLEKGFWTVTLERFFILERYMMTFPGTDIQPIIHIENDVLLYENIAKYWHVFAEKYSGKIACTLDSPHRVIAGFIYIDGIRPLSAFTDYIIRNIDRNENDMVSLAHFYRDCYPEFIDTLPIIPDEKFDPIYRKNIADFDNSIFDAAAIGQFIGGVDPRNIPGDTRGFINETCIFKCIDYEINFDIPGKPTLIYNGKSYPIFNLHIHSKNLRPYLTPITSTDI